MQSGIPLRHHYTTSRPRVQVQAYKEFVNSMEPAGCPYAEKRGTTVYSIVYQTSGYIR
jgi:hypothetical protein